jgi:hypothetical protein
MTKPVTRHNGKFGMLFNKTFFQYCRIILSRPTHNALAAGPVARHGQFCMEIPGRFRIVFAVAFPACRKRLLSPVDDQGFP